MLDPNAVGVGYCFPHIPPGLPCPMSHTLLLCVHPQQSQHRRRSLAPINTAPPTQAPQSPAAALTVPLGTLAFALRDILDMKCATSLEMVIRERGEC